MLLNFGQSAALQQPFNARAVWTTINESFHVCWDSHNTSGPKPLPAPTAYIIRDSNFLNLTHTLYDDHRNKSYCTDLRYPFNHENVIIQAVSRTELPSEPLHINITGM